MKLVSKEMVERIVYKTDEHDGIEDYDSLNYIVYVNEKNEFVDAELRRAISGHTVEDPKVMEQMQDLVLDMFAKNDSFDEWWQEYCMKHVVQKEDEDIKNMCRQAFMEGTKLFKK